MVEALNVMLVEVVVVLVVVVLVVKYSSNIA